MNQSVVYVVRQNPSQKPGTLVISSLAFVNLNLRFKMNCELLSCQRRELTRQLWMKFRTEKVPMEWYKTNKPTTSPFVK
jgi:hypothetical protein